MFPICLTGDSGTPWHLCISKKDEGHFGGSISREGHRSPLLSLPNGACWENPVPGLPPPGGGRGVGFPLSRESCSGPLQTSFQAGSNLEGTGYGRQTMALSQQSNCRSQPRKCEAAKGRVNSYRDVLLLKQTSLNQCDSFFIKVFEESNFI